ncbi:MAG: RNA polymerase factor sigma-54 [Bacteroidales bacterium]|nr:RNA polymerase factor sigma-54 [Bacteroidales bacterium]
MLNQRLQQKLLQKLSPQQILLMKLLQIPTISLEQRIKQEIEDNPVLEEMETDEENKDEDKLEEETDSDNDDVDNEEFDLEDYLNEGDIPDYKLRANNNDPNKDEKKIPYASGISFQDFLISQLGLRILDEREYNIAMNIIGNIDDAGYLYRDLNSIVDDLAFSQNITTDKQELESILKIIQEFDPPGVGAQSLQECLLIQLKRKQNHNKAIEQAIFIIERYFDEFTKKHYDKIIKRTGFTEKELKAAIEEILKLNPKPGNSLGVTEKVNHYIIPDFIIYNKEGHLELELTSRDAPELIINKNYLGMLESYAATKKKTKEQKKAISFIKQKIDSAKWFIDALKQRQHTLYITMNAIMNYQEEYFLTGDETKLRPMILKDIAEIVNLDISTISRVANSKYVQTPFGTFLLKSFFSESMQTLSGEIVSTREIKKILAECIENEDKSKPYTDENLVKILKEKGYSIARRTIAKYREQLGIPVARLRKKL